MQAPPPGRARRGPVRPARHPVPDALASGVRDCFFSLSRTAYTERNTFTNIIQGLRPQRNNIASQEREVTINKTNCANHQPAVLYRRIGSTTYKVRVHFSDTGTETMNDKIVRLIQNEALTSAPDCAIMETPQMSQPPEGSSL